MVYDKTLPPLWSLPIYMRISLDSSFVCGPAQNTSWFDQEKNSGMVHQDAILPIQDDFNSIFFSKLLKFFLKISIIYFNLCKDYSY